MINQTYGMCYVVGCHYVPGLNVQIYIYNYVVVAYILPLFSLLEYICIISYPRPHPQGGKGLVTQVQNLWLALKFETEN